MTRLRYNLEDLSTLPIQDCELYYCMSRGAEAAGSPFRSINDGPYGPSSDTRIRCYRIAWRTAFRRARRIRDDKELAKRFNAMCGRPAFEVAA